MGARESKGGGRSLLIINSGSSSVRFSARELDDASNELFSGKINRIGLDKSSFTWKDGKDGSQAMERRSFGTHETATRFLIRWLDDKKRGGDVVAVGHRIVHGGPKYFEPSLVTPELLKELKRITPYDPEHLPAQIALIKAFQQEKPKLPQVACFDTAFHKDMPLAAKMFAIPRKYFAEGLHRYGFHGLSYAFILGEIERLEGVKAARGRLIFAHLGNGASLAAVRDGKSIDTTMSFTPTAGVPMSSRSGDLDPGLFLFLMRKKGMTPNRFQKLVNYESGLLGISETTSDMRDLQDWRKSDKRAAEAIDLFCYQVKKVIGGFAAGLGGIDTLVFAGGIGENDSRVRTQICEGLGFLGIKLAVARNDAGHDVISSGRVKVRVIRTNEELVIARAVCHIVKNGGQ